jgi:hypothetical protein
VYYSEAPKKSKGIDEMMFNDRRTAKPTMAPAMSEDRKSYKVSESVTVKAKRGKTLDAANLEGAAQARQENARTSAPTGAGSKTSNARGLKAANAGSMATPEQQEISNNRWRERHDVKQEAQYGTSSRPRYQGQNWTRGDAYKDAAKAVEREQKKAGK